MGREKYILEYVTFGEGMWSTNKVGKRYKTSQKLAQQGKRVRPHPALDPHGCVDGPRALISDPGNRARSVGRWPGHVFGQHQRDCAWAWLFRNGSYKGLVPGVDV
jgi:hypothetical protein